MAIPRNPIYRPRRVQIKLFTKPVSLSRQPDLVFDLTEVNMIEFDSVSTTAVGNGAVISVLQPWYFQPITINITGRSYIGAFDQGPVGIEGTDIASDRDIEKIIELRQIVNEKFFNSFASVKDLRFQLTYDDPNDTENISASQVFIGFFNQIRYGENDKDPYIKGYTLRFIGEDEKLLSLLNGTNKSKEDIKQSDEERTNRIDKTSQTASKEKLAKKRIVSIQDDIRTDPTGKPLQRNITDSDGFWAVKKRTQILGGEEIKTETYTFPNGITGDGKESDVVITEKLEPSPSPNNPGSRVLLPQGVGANVSSFNLTTTSPSGPSL